MADQSPAVTFINHSPEKVALDLLQMIALIEKRSLHSGPPAGWTAADRQWLLDTYAECIQSVREPEERRLGDIPAELARARLTAHSRKT